MEEFRVVKGFENYLINTLGKVYSKYSNKYIKTNFIGNSGYYQVKLRINGRQVNKSLHRLLAETFIPNPNKFRTINHINGNKLDNRLENLEWANDCYQQYHAYLTGLKKHTKHVLTEGEIIQVYEKYSKGQSMYSLAKEYGTRKQQIAKLLKGQRHSELFGQYREKFNL